MHQSGSPVQDMSATASKVWSAMPSMRFGSSAASKAVKVAKAEGKAASTSEGKACLSGRYIQAQPKLAPGILTTSVAVTGPHAIRTGTDTLCCVTPASALQ